jgi:hypothetical protein
MLGINGEWLRVLERRGEMMRAVSESQGQLMFNAESGDIISPFDAMQEHTNLSEIEPRIKNQSDTPRRAGGLMNWAASKAVGPLV